MQSHLRNISKGGLDGKATVRVLCRERGKLWDFLNVHKDNVESTSVSRISRKVLAVKRKLERRKILVSGARLAEGKEG